MRSDFRSRLREYPQLTECINKPYINVEHLNREEIAEAIVKPADWVGLGIEGQLPHIQHFLTQSKVFSRETAISGIGSTKILNKILLIDSKNIILYKLQCFAMVM